jgi:hypothetical protein
VLQAQFAQAIDTLTPSHISKRRLELLLGLSQGYLSRLRSGSGNPSPTLVYTHVILALDPATRLAELEKFQADALGGAPVLERGQNDR